MSTHKHIDKICCVVLALTLILTLLFMNAESFGVLKKSTAMGYEETLFDSSAVHTINIVMDNWDDFIDNCTSEDYYACSVIIDNEAYKNVAIRAKGNTSLSQVASYGNNRYSFKIEFDHYDSTNTYYGLDKLCLNNIIQDNTYMKDYLTYQMMNETGVASPLCSFVYITVNGEDWGLYLAVEGVEESFLQRNYGSDYGELYKPDSMSMGGGRGNGKNFNMDDFTNTSEADSSNDTANEISEPGNNDNSETTAQTPDETAPSNPMPDGMPGEMPDGLPSEMPDGFQGEMPNGMPGGQMPGNMTPPTDSFDSSGNSGGDITPPTDGAFPDNSQQDADNSSDQNEMPDNAFNKMQIADIAGGKMGIGSDDVLLKYIDDDFDSYSNIFDNAKTKVSDADKTRLIEALKKLSNAEDLENTVEVESVIRYFVVHNFVLNFDSYTGSMIHNYYLYENDGQLQMIPWDYNLAFGGFQSMSSATSLVNYPIDSPVSGGSTEDRPMIAWIFESEEYTELYHQYFSEFISEYFDSGYFEEMMDRVAAMISPYVEKDPTKFCTYEEFETGITTLKEFCLLRAESVSGQLNGTIGSTSDTQKSDTLIDAGDIQISDMGSMGSTMGNKAQPGGGRQISQNGSDGNGTQPFSATDNSDAGTDFADQASDEASSAADNRVTGDNAVPSLSGNRQDGQTPNAEQESKASSDSSDNENDVGDPGGPGDQLQQADRNRQTPPQGQNATSSSSWIMLGISVFVLALGLVFAFGYKRRK